MLGRPALRLRHGRNRLGGVLHDVGERLRQQPAVEGETTRWAGRTSSERDLGMRDPHHEHHLANGLAMSSSPMVGFGMRAKDENSSTMRLMSSTCRTIVAVHWSNTSRSVVMTLPYLRRMRSPRAGWGSADS
jgi:hypothetical protein